jgi:hypothetical protein
VVEARTELADDQRSAHVHLAWRAPDGGTGQADGDVEVTRVLPVLVCGEPPEAAKKSSPEYRLRSLSTD